MPAPDQMLLALADPAPSPTLPSAATPEILCRMADLMDQLAIGRLPEPATEEVGDEVLR